MNIRIERDQAFHDIQLGVQKKNSMLYRAVSAPPTRTARNGGIPIYLWQEPMTLDAIEVEARKLSRGGLISPDAIEPVPQPKGG